MNFFSCPYQGQRDAILALYRQGRPGFDPRPYPSLEQLDRTLSAASTGTAESVRVWLDSDGELAAYALIEADFANLIFEVHPRAAGCVEAEMIAWAAQQIGRANREDGEANPLETYCFAGDTDRSARLLAHGFERIEGDTVRLLRALDEPIPKLQLPSGFSLRACQGEQDAESYAELHRAAFGSAYMTAERRLEMMRRPGYDPDLDLVAVAPDGIWAAFVVGGWDLTCAAPGGGKLGWTDPIGTHPDFRRMGLSRCLTARALLLLKAGGATHAAVGTLSTNTAMLAVLRSLNYVEVQRFIWYGKTV